MSELIQKLAIAIRQEQEAQMALKLAKRRRKKALKALISIGETK